MTSPTDNVCFLRAGLRGGPMQDVLQTSHGFVESTPGSLWAGVQCDGYSPTSLSCGIRTVSRDPELYLAQRPIP